MYLMAKSFGRVLAQDGKCAAQLSVPHKGRHMRTGLDVT